MAPSKDTEWCSLWHQKKGHSSQTSLSRLRDFQRKLSMVSAGMCREGKTRIHFIDTQKTESELRHLHCTWIPDMNPRLSKFVPLANTLVRYIFQQDGATSRTSKVTQEHLDEEEPEFIKKSSGCRSRPIAILWIIMCIWDSLSEKVYCGAALKNSLRRNSSKGSLNAGNKYILLNLESPLDRGKRDFGPFVVRTEDQSFHLD
jgi:hypothetical protein